MDQGFAVIEGVLPSNDMDRLVAHAEQALGEGAGDRNALSWPWVQEVAADPRLFTFPVRHLGSSCIPVRAILFDKQPGANWNLGYHQDRAVALAEQIEVQGFDGWSVKDRIPHALAPAETLEQMLAVRLSLDDCGPENGPLRVLPGSHLHGLLSREKVKEWEASTPEHVCTVKRGGVVLMKPLLLHASSAATVPSHRRVLHIEYALPTLPGGLKFYSW